MIFFPIILISSHICLLNEWYRPLNFFVVFLLSVMYIYFMCHFLYASVSASYWGSKQNEKKFRGISYVVERGVNLNFNLLIGILFANPFNL